MRGHLDNTHIGGGGGGADSTHLYNSSISKDMDLKFGTVTYPFIFISNM